jgi:hypothetical protein
MVTSTFRADMRAAGLALLNGFRTATGLIRQEYDAIPRSFKAPLGFVGDFAEPAISHTMSLRTRTPQMEIVLVVGVYDNAEAAHLQDQIVQGFMDYVSNRPHQVSGATLIQPISTRDTTLTLGVGERAANYRATVVTVEGDIQEGLD